MKNLKVLILPALAAALLPTGLPTFLSAQSNTADAHKRPMTFEDMTAMKRLGETAVSPDGKWLAYSVTTVDLEKNKKRSELWLQKIEGGEPVRIAVTQPGDNGLQFAPDGHSVLFLSAREGSEQIWTASFDAASGATANPKRLTSIRTEAGDAIWSPTSKAVVFTSSVYPDCPAITFADGISGDKCNGDRDAEAAANPVKAQIFTHLLYKHWDHFTGAKRGHLFLLDVESGKVRDLTPNDPRDVPPFALGGGCGCAISPDGKELAFTENLEPEPAISTNADIFTLDLTNDKAKPVQISTAKGGDFNPAYSPDGKYIAWRSEERNGYESDKFRLFLYDRAAKTEKDLLPKFENWVDEFAWKGSSTIFFTSGEHGIVPIYQINILSGQIQKIAVRGEYSGLLTLSTPSDPALAGSMQKFANLSILATEVKVDHPAEVVWIYVSDASSSFKGNHDHPEIPINDAQFKRLTHLNDDLLSQLDLPKMQDFWFTAEDGTRLQGFVIPPPGFDATKKYPVKFLIHGGPQGAWGDAWSYRWNAELFAANGYVVVMVNPRGSTGYGQKVVDGVNGDWGGKPFSDLMLGLDEAEKKFSFIDKNRECALGASYGGYMANWVLGHTDRFKCIVSHDGMFNPESAYGSTEELWFNEWEFKGHPWDYYGKPDSENPFRKWSPAMSAKNFKTPTLVIHSQLDYRLDVSEGYQLFTTLQRLGVPSKMLYFPDENHWVLKPQNSRLWYRTVNDWVDQWTGTGNRK